MRDKNPDCYHLSASAINALKACPTRFRLAYREGLRLAADTEAQRMGTNWHALHEEYNRAVRLGGSPEVAYEKAVEHLNERYSEVPTWVSAEAWETERLVLLTSFHVYQWYYTNDPVESFDEELAFDLPLHEPRTGMPLPTSEVIRVGKIDGLVLWQNRIVQKEMKSTSKNIGPDSDYWDRSQKDTQVSMYALAMRDLRASGQIPESLLRAQAHTWGNTLYDVWKKPKTRPKSLTQKASLEFVESSKYFDQEFNVAAKWQTEIIIKNKGKKTEREEKKKTLLELHVDGQSVEVARGKQGFAIRETPRMYAARLMDEMVNDPESYFVRKEIARTDDQLRRFRVELYRIYQAMRSYERTGAWFENENQCRATFKCAYLPICYGEGADKVCDNNLTPPDFRRIFNVTVNGEDINDQED